MEKKRRRRKKSDKQIDSIVTPASKPKKRKLTIAEQEEIAKTIDPIFSLSLAERIEILTTEETTHAPITAKAISALISKYVSMTAAEFEALVAVKSRSLTMLERGIINSVSNQQAKNKTSENSKEKLYDRMVGQSKELKEISGPNGGSISLASQEAQLATALENKTPEEIEVLKKHLLGIKSSL